MINISSLHQLQRREGTDVVKYLLGASNDKVFYADDSTATLSIASLTAIKTLGGVTDHFKWITLSNKAICYPDGLEPFHTDGTTVYNLGVVKPAEPVDVVENAIGNMASGDYYVGYSYQRSGDFAYETNVSTSAKVNLAKEENEIDVALMYDVSETAFADVTTSFNDAETNVPIFEEDDDCLYIGDTLKFISLNVLLSTNASVEGLAPVFEYSKGGDIWAEFNPSDTTYEFTADGQITWVSADLEGWATETVNGVTSKYWIRIIRTQESLSVVPVEKLIEVTNTNKSIDMPVIASEDPQIDKIRIFCSTLGGTTLYWVKDVDNVTATVNIDAENVSGYEAPTTYKVSPQAKYCIVKANRSIIANTDDDGVGSAVVRWSEPNQPDTFEETSFYVYDAEDGDEITGLGDMLNYIVVFKKNKMMLLDAQSLSGNVGVIEISSRYGCIASDSIQTVLGGRAITYLSNEGLILFDGKQNVSLSDGKMDARFEEMDVTLSNMVKSVFYPAYQRYSIFIPLTGGETTWINYYFKSNGFTEWNLFTPNYITLVKDNDDNTKIIVGTPTTMAEIDYLVSDDGSDIAWSFQTVEHTLGLESADKVMRRAYLDWKAEGQVSGEYTLEVDYGTRTGITKHPVHSGRGRVIDRIDLNGTGKAHSIKLSARGQQDVVVYGMNMLFYPLSYEGVVD